MWKNYYTPVNQHYSIHKTRLALHITQTVEPVEKSSVNYRKQKCHLFLIWVRNNNLISSFHLMVTNSKPKVLHRHFHCIFSRKLSWDWNALFSVFYYILIARSHKIQITLSLIKRSQKREFLKNIFKISIWSWSKNESVASAFLCLKKFFLSSYTPMLLIFLPHKVKC